MKRPPTPPSAKRLPLPPPLPRVPFTSTQTFAKGERPTAFPPVEAPTPTKNRDIAMYQGLLSVFDEMSHVERLDFVELALAFKELTPEDRQWLVDEINQRRGR